MPRAPNLATQYARESQAVEEMNDGCTSSPRVTYAFYNCFIGAGGLTAYVGTTAAVRMVARDAFGNALPHSGLNISALNATLTPNLPGNSIRITQGIGNSTWLLLE